MHNYWSPPSISQYLLLLFLTSLTSQYEGGDSAIHPINTNPDVSAETNPHDPTDLKSLATWLSPNGQVTRGADLLRAHPCSQKETETRMKGKTVHKEQRQMFSRDTSFQDLQVTWGRQT